MRSEAAYLDLVTEDATQGFIVRLCRYPHEGYAWLWGHLFLEGRTYAFTQHELHCDATPVPIERERVVYRSDEGWSSLTIEREGTLAAVSSARARATFEMHEGRHAPHGPGAIETALEAEFTPSAHAVSNREGRHEALGKVSARVTIGRHVLELDGRGQFHEQIQTDPRFISPFTYATVRGERAGFVFIRGANGARGHWIDAYGAARIDRVEISPPGSERRVILHGSGRTWDGVLHTTYDYTIPIATQVRAGTIVRGEVAGVAMSGCVNDYLVDQLRYERL